MEAKLGAYAMDMNISNRILVNKYNDNQQSYYNTGPHFLIKPVAETKIQNFENFPGNFDMPLCFTKYIRVDVLTLPGK